MPLVLAHGPCPLAKPSVLKGKARAAQLYPCAREEDLLGKSSQKKKPCTVCLSHDALRRDVESEWCATRSALCVRDRHRIAWATGPARARAEQQTIEDALRALTRILCVAFQSRHHAPALDINISTRY